MDFMQHIPSEVLRIFLRGELSVSRGEEVRLHLSFCPICQEQEDDMLLDDLVPQVVAAFERKSIPPDEHLEERVLKRFWGGEIKDEGQLVRISEHCLACRACREKRYEIWKIMREESAIANIAPALRISFLSSLAVRVWRLRKMKSLRHAHRAAVLFLLLVLLLPILFSRYLTWPHIGRKNAAHISADVQEKDDGAHYAPPQVEPVQVSAQAAATSPSLNRSSGEAGAKVWSARRNSNPKGIGSRRAKAEGAQTLIELTDQPQALDLSVLTSDVNVRGAGKDEGEIEAPLIVRSSIADTRLRIDLPENSRTGRYIVSLQDPARLGSLFGAPLASDEDESSDGKQISVSLDLRGLPEKEYHLILMRENEESGDEEFLGYVTVRLSEPKINGRRAVK